MGRCQVANLLLCYRSGYGVEPHRGAPYPLNGLELGSYDKPGSMLNLRRWTSPRMVKETFIPPADFHDTYMHQSLYQKDRQT